ncbi:hypothetical protein FB451DRAFT_1187471 [Mycena latifolia]|nr:hypothetical protein FB451DRAFT_1187471 [Mycena latifolia]
MSAAQFTTQLFESIFFQKDAAKAISTFEADVAPDAKITFNGTDLSAAQFLEAIKGYHSTGFATLTSPQETLAVTPLEGNAAVVALIVRAKHTLNAGTTQNMVSVSIIKIEEKGGKQVVTSWVENQERTPA